MEKRFYTTFDISDMCGVGVTTIVDWVESGKLKAHKTLGGHRRISKQDLVEFLKKNKFPIPEEISGMAEKILIVDDEQPIVEYIERVLKALDFEYETDNALTGFEAGDKLNQFGPDIVILDIKLPGINGYEVCRAIKQRDPNIKVIAISGSNNEATKRKVIQAGADAFLPKPFVPKALLEEVMKNR